MLMHEWIRYRSKQVRKAVGDDEEPDEDAALEAEESAEAEEAALQPEEPESAEPQEQAEDEPAEEETAAPPAPQAATADAESTSREREEVLSSIQAELGRTGQSMAERMRQLHARQKQLPIEVQEAQPAEDYDEGRRASETRQDLIERLLDPVLTLREAALLLDVCPTTVRRYTNRGLLNCFRTPGNQRRFHLSDVLDFLERRERGEI